MARSTGAQPWRCAEGDRPLEQRIRVHCSDALQLPQIIRGCDTALGIAQPPRECARATAGRARAGKTLGSRNSHDAGRSARLQMQSGSGGDREALREILTRKPPNLVRLRLKRGCSNALCSKVEPKRALADVVRVPLDGLPARVASRQANGLLEAIHGRLQAAERKARRYGRLRTVRTLIFMIADAWALARTILRRHLMAPLVFQLSHRCEDKSAQASLCSMTPQFLPGAHAAHRVHWLRYGAGC